jgi:hypothetical protein
MGNRLLLASRSAKVNMFDNASEETRYIYTGYDENGQLLDGKDRFTVTFAPDGLPPVKGFWSLTLCNKEHPFYPNKRNRYSLETINKSMKKNHDGSLRLYFQGDSPRRGQRV